MSYLTKLTPTAFLPNERDDDFTQLRIKLIQSLDCQSQHCEALLNDGVFMDMVRIWLRCEDDALCLPADRFYWQHKTGAWIITLRVEDQILPISSKHPSIEVGHADDIPNALNTLKLAVKAGELDAQLKQHLEMSKPTPNILSDTLDVIPYMDACDRYHLQQIVQAFELRHQAKKLLQVRDKTGEHC